MAVVLPIISEWNPAGVKRAMADIQKAGSNFDKFAVGVEHASRVASVALVGLAAVGANFAKAAADDAQAAQILSKTLQNTTNATDEQIKSTEAWITAQGRLLGVSDDKLRPALGKLVTATKDVSKAQELASLAMDISAARGLDLDSVSQSLAKAYSGNFTALKKLIPGIDEAAIKSGDFAKVQAALNQIVGGSAATAAQTAAGQYAIMTLQLQEAKEAIGAGLLPAFQALIPTITAVTFWLQDHGQAVANIAKIVAGFAGTIVGLNYVIKTIEVLTKAWAAAQWLLNLALAANPLTLFVLAVAAVIGVLIYAYNSSEKFRQSVKDLVQDIKNAVSWFGKFAGFASIFKSLSGSATITNNIAPMTSSTSGGGSTSAGGSIFMTDEMVARGIANILAKSDLRNGSSLAFS